MRGLGTDHVISGPMRGLKKYTDGHGVSITELAQWGQFSEKHFHGVCSMHRQHGIEYLTIF